jgi:hypothetical protein
MMPQPVKELNWCLLLQDVGMNWWDGCALPPAAISFPDGEERSLTLEVRSKSPPQRHRGGSPFHQHTG